MKANGPSPLFRAVVIACLLWARSSGAQTESGIDEANPAGSGSKPDDAASLADAPTAPADAPTAEDDVGFGGPTSFGSLELAPAAEQPSPFELTATLRVQGAVRTETDMPSRLAKLRQVLDVELEYDQPLWAAARLQAVAAMHSEADFAYLLKREAYDPVTFETEAWLLRAGETYLALTWSALELSFGYRIVNFGQGEMVSVLDVVNPRDLREPMPTDTNVTHLPVLLTQIGVAIEKLQLEAVLVHETYFGLIPPPLGEFNPFRRLLLEDASIGESLAGRTLRNAHEPDRDFLHAGALQPYGRVRWSTGPLDVALVVGSPLDRLGVPSLPPPSAFTAEVIEMPIVHPRYTMLGHSGSLSIGPFLVRWELAFNLKRTFAARAKNTELLQLSSVRSDELQGMIGLTYLPSSSTSAAFELAKSHLRDSPNQDALSAVETLFPTEAPQFALRFNTRFLRERASLSLVAVLIGVDPMYGLTARVELAYSISDTIEVATGYVTYLPTEHFGYFYGFDQHDRAFLNLRWDIADR